MKKYKFYLLFSILCFGIGFFGFLFAYNLGAMDNPDCVVVNGVWLKQDLRPDLHYSFIFQGNVYNYHAQNEFALRDDLNIRDDIRIKLCWDDSVNGFLTKGVEKQ